MSDTYDGILLVDKPSGWTSFDVVAKVRSIIKSQIPSTKSQTSSKDSNPKPKKVKVGHAGTLDPLATGLMIILVGSYCKRAQEFSKLDKTYDVTMRLGQTSTTGDEEGEKTTISTQQPSRAEIETALNKFTGEILQTPPIYSAIKVNGQRAYKLARAGKEVKLEPRKVEVYSTQLTAYRYPEVKFTAKVSSGTYIRSLVEDIGTKIETGAYLTALRRTRTGNFELPENRTPDQLTVDKIAEFIEKI